jgi:hypothetical protein
LSLFMFGQGRAWLEDLAFTDGYLIPIYVGWCQHNNSHATITVDERKQEPNPGGYLNVSLLSERVKVADVSAEDTYPGLVSVYRRCVSLLRDPADGSAYVLDIFRVKGGKRHDYSLHAGDAEMRAEGIVFGEPQPGTVAGRDVPYADPRGFDLQPGQIMEYRGSGYQFLANPAYAEAKGPWRLTWQDGNRGMMVSVPGGLAKQVIVADGQRYWQKKDQPHNDFKYMIIRREGEKELESAFTTAIDIFSGKPVVGEVRSLAVEGGNGSAVAVAVQRGESEDHVVHNLDRTSKVKAGGMEVSGSYAYVCNRQGKFEYMTLLDGGYMAVEGCGMELEDKYQAVVERVDERTHSIVIKGAKLPGGAILAGQKLLVERPEGGAAEYEIESVEGQTVRLRASSFVLNSGIVKGYDAAARVLSSGSPSLMLATPGPHGRGLSLSIAGQSKWLRAKPTGKALHHGDETFQLVLDGDPEQQPQVGDQFFTWSIGPGDKVRVPVFAALERTSAMRYRILANTRMQLTLPAAERAHIWIQRAAGWYDCGPASGATLTPEMIGTSAVELAVAARSPVYAR